MAVVTFKTRISDSVTCAEDANTKFVSVLGDETYGNGEDDSDEGEYGKMY